MPVRSKHLSEEMRAAILRLVVRNLEVIGEAAKRVDDAYRAVHPEVPWRALAGMRHVLIHQYEGSTSSACGWSLSATFRRSDGASDRWFRRLKN